MKFFRNKYLAILAGVAVTTSPVLAQTVGLNSAVRNNVKVQQTANANAQTARIRQPVKMRNVVTTAASSALQITLLDRSSLTVGPSARLTVNRFVYDPKTKKSSVGTSLVKGTLRFMSGKAARGGRNSINTPAASIGIRGTIVELAVGEDAISIGRLQQGLGMGTNVDPQTASLIVLRGPGPNAQLGEKTGIIDVTAGGKTVTLTQPGSAVFVPALGAVPSAPFQLSNNAFSGFDNMLRTQPNSASPSSNQQSSNQNSNTANNSTATQSTGSSAGGGTGAGGAGGGGAGAGAGAAGGIGGIGGGALAGVLGGLAAAGLAAVAVTSGGNNNQDEPVSP
ncbi:FecR family protein [Parasphingorhabdus sp.]|uniref:FecR family protein n=1 Tax=Parasphingorhabdus sp. TaxID=2709688 RepID=UPI003A930883